MKIDWVKISGFGMLSNMEKSFEDINNICLPNSSGKSTLASFVVAMFYGLSGSARQKQLAKNDRERFCPWNGAPFGGSLAFTLDNGKKYVVERFFGKTEKADTFKLFNAENNTESKDFSSELGKELFLVDADTLERTAFVSDRLLDDKGIDGIKSKLHSAVFDDDNNYEQALFALRTSMGERKNSGLRKKLEELETERYNLLRELSEAKELEHKAMIAMQKREQAEQDIAKLNHRKQELKEKQVNLSEQAKNQAVVGKRDALQEQLENRQRMFEEAKYKEEFFECEFAVLELHEKYIAEKEPKIEEKNNIRIEKNDWIFFGVFLAAFFVGFICLFLVLPLGVIICSLSLVLPVLYYIFVIKPKNVRFFAQLECDRQEEYNKNKEQLFAKIKEYLQNYNDNIMPDNYLQIFYQIKAEAQMVENLRQDFFAARSELQAFEREHSKELQQKYEYNAESIDSLLDEVERLIVAQQLLLKEQQIFLDRYFESADDAVFVQTKLSECNEQIAAVEGMREDLKLAHEFLLKAHEELSMNYVPKISRALNEVCLKIFEDLGEAGVDDALDIFVMDKGRRIPLAAFSRGVKEALALALRFALVDAIFGEEKPFLIFDDPFVNLDSTKIEGLKQLLHSMSKEYQIIYFTCHSSRSI